MASPYGQPLIGNGPPGIKIVPTGQPYIDQIGQKLWRPTNNPSAYSQISGTDGAGLNTRATLSGGVVTVTRGGKAVQTITT